VMARVSDKTRGDRNQNAADNEQGSEHCMLQWGPVVVTGIRIRRTLDAWAVAGVAALQWGPVVVTGISTPAGRSGVTSDCFNGVRSW